MGELRKAYKLVVRKSEGKRPRSGRPRCILQNNTEMYHNKIKYDGVHRI
jgi:hypothetical protein